MVRRACAGKGSGLGTSPLPMRLEPVSHLPYEPLIWINPLLPVAAILFD